MNIHLRCRYHDTSSNYLHGRPPQATPLAPSPSPLDKQGNFLGKIQPASAAGVGCGVCTLPENRCSYDPQPYILNLIHLLSVRLRDE